ncbi:hypothetical protein M422DRAFT_776697 [Sphaerobolus stellatus SS14]|nr:hypothetical protein M422DRAFT_776697 [Sphaerobolus stellatus SS14]
MEGNFPKDLSIHASDPKSIIRLFSLGIPSNLSQDITEEQAIIESQASNIKAYGIAGRIWEAAYALMVYLQPHTRTDFDPPSSLFEYRPGAIIELGAGTGYLGLAMARYISSKSQASDTKTLVLTDLPDVCSLLDRNRIQEIPDGLPAVKLLIEPLSWGNLEHGKVLADKLTGILSLPQSAPLLSHIICSDLVYFPDLLAPLLRTLLQLSSPPFSSTTQPVQIIMSYMVRSLTKETPFWSAFGTWFDFTPVLYRDKDGPWQRLGDGETDTCFLFVATRKAKTLAWAIPSDAELLERGSEVFETLLLMNIPQDE